MATKLWLVYCMGLGCGATNDLVFSKARSEVKCGMEAICQCQCQYQIQFVERIDNTYYTNHVECTSDQIKAILNMMC